MGVCFVLYCILQLPWFLRAASSDCQEKCGDIDIRSPFGMKTGCYHDSRFRVTCNETPNGRKPFISSIHLELLGWSSQGDNIVIVNNSVTYLNCGDKGNNRSTSPSNVDLQGSPFFFTSRFNGFGSIGCGNLATLFRNNETTPISSCLQRSCGDMSSESGGCFVTISENFTSYTASTVEVINPGSKRCASAFLVSKNWLTSQRILGRVIGCCHQIQAFNFSTITSDCDQIFKGVPAQAQHYRRQDRCDARCGNVDIPYPFGIQVGFYLNDWFRVTCNETTDGPKVYITSIGLQLLNVSILEGTVVVNNSITYSDCLETDGISVDLADTPFSFSAFYNRFMSVGCGSLATFFHGPIDKYPAGACMQPICGNVASDVDCTTDFSWDLSSFSVNMKHIYPRNASGKECGSAFIVDRRYLEIIKHRNVAGNWTMMHVPVTLRWSTQIRGQCDCWSDYMYSTIDGEYNWSNLSRSYLCVCVSNTDGTISTDSCQGQSGTCTDFYWNNIMLCLNTSGNECSSSCPEGYEYSGFMCKRRELKKQYKKSLYLAIIIGCSTSLGTLLALIGTWHLLKVWERRKGIKLKQKYFKRNGGLLLQQQLSGNEGNVVRVRLFTSKELEKATDYFNENRILGHGGQGTVYKGILTDGSIVAIKKSNVMDKKKYDETKLKQFINEVMLLSQINHRNVVKLLGCCLETKVPLLVYEFIPNGTLSHLIHAPPNEEFQFTWEMRLRIAIKISNALSYLHSSASVPTYHLDIKSSNILLDDKYRAKVSDFGTSSFGVVLAEIITGQKPISLGQSEEEVRSLVNIFLLSMKDHSLLDIVDPMVMNGGPEAEIVAVAKLAKRYLNLNGKKRPTMREVALELEQIRSSEGANDIEENTDEDSDIDDMNEPSSTASCSLSSSIC
ncbi:hypothetical protein V6N13_133833 [Hibiscus sabdariffa]